MKPALSVLDPSPLFSTMIARNAFAESLALAKAVDGMSYRSYWVQEHHNAPSFAGTAPEVLLAALSQKTQRIKLGSGGVMLPNYSPLKVAEQFCALEALAPGRIELGVGRATGADPRASAALLGPGGEAFPNMLRLLMDWMLDASGEVPLPANHRARGIHVGPHGARPDLWMLCSSAASAAFVGAMGLKMAYAEFLGPGGAAEAIAAYKQAFTPSAFADAPHAAIGLVVLAADSKEEAEHVSRPALAWNVVRATGQFMSFPTHEDATTILNQADDSTLTAMQSRSISGSIASVVQSLEAFAAQTEADEFFLLTLGDGYESRLKSYQLLHEAWR